MVGACSKWVFWCYYDRQGNFTYILEELPFQIFDSRPHIWNFFKKSKSHPFFEGFMHKIRLTSKKKCLKNPKFSFSSKSLQIHSKHRKLVPNHCATLGKWLGSTFDHLNEFKTTFGKSNFGAQKALFPYWRLRRLQNQAFHGPQNMVGACSKWAFWRHYGRQSSFTYILEELPFQIFD